MTQTFDPKVITVIWIELQLDFFAKPGFGKIT